MQFSPFPRPYLKTYISAALITGFSIAFILIVFQPFGTDTFEHQYKWLILSGYGAVATLSIIIYYALSLYWFNKKRDNRWTVLHESVDLFLALMIGLLMCYFYFAIIFDYSISIAGMTSFLIRAASVSLLPVVGIFAYLYSEYRDLKRSSISFSSDQKEDQRQQTITLKGSNKGELIKVTGEDLLYVKAEDNYVILHLSNEADGLQRHMIRSTMKQIMDQLSSGAFYQCHRSYIINKDRIVNLTGNKNDTKVDIALVSKKIPVSRNKVDELKTMLAM